MKFVEYPDREMLMIELANKMVSGLNDQLIQHPSALLAVPGGTTPGPIFDVLSAVDLEWDRVCVILTDERWVPQDDPRSNTRLLKERLLVDRAASARLLPLYADASTPEDKIGELSAALMPQLPISVLLLGMGADMHTASLFPGADNLEQALAPGAPVLMAMRAPGAPEPRITLTAPVLDNALSKHIIITGDEKRRAVERAQQLDAIKAPVTSVWNGATVHWAA